jgi:hypothetical protein
MTLPNFLIVGAMKAGTTSLFRYLRQHPGVFMPEKKEPQFFCEKGGLEWNGPDVNRPRRYEIEEYTALFAGAGGFAARGEASTTYLCDPVAPGRIRDGLSDVRLIAVLRQPVDRAYSAWLMMRWQGWERRGFKAALRVEPERIASGWQYAWQYAALGRYAEQLERYLRTFPSSRIKIVLFDDLRDDPAGVTRDVFRFLGVDESFQPETATTHNPAKAALSPRLSRWMTHPSGIRERAKRILPGAARRLWDWAAAANRQLNVAAPPRLSRSLRAKLTRGWDGDIRRLEAVIGRDLSAWRES